MSATGDTPTPFLLPRLTDRGLVLVFLAVATLALITGLLVQDLGPVMLIGCLGIAGGIVSVLRPGIGLFLFTLMMYTRASEVLTTSIGLPSIAPLFTIWLMTGIVMHFGIGGLFRARPTGWQVLVLYGLVLLASTLVASNPWAATWRVVDYVRELVYIALIVAYVRQRTDLQIVVRALIVAGVIPACLTIYQTLTGSANSFLGFGLYSQAIVIPGEITEVARPAGMVGDPNFYAMALIALIPLAFHRARWEPTVTGRQLAFLAAVLISIASIMTYSRGGYISLAAVVLGLSVAGFIRWRSLIIVGLAFTMLLPFLPASYTGRASSLLEIPAGLISREPPDRGTATDTSVSGRVSEVMAGVHMFLDNPILGVGTNNYQEHYQEYSRPMGVDRRTDRAAHSLYVEIAAETGLFGIVTFAALVITLFASLRSVWRATNTGSELHDLALAVAVSLAALLLSSVFLHFAYPRFFMVFAGLTLAIVSVQNWRLAPGTRVDFSRIRPTQEFFTPLQHQRVIVWGGAAAIVAVLLVSALALSLSIDRSGGGLFQRQTVAAISPPADLIAQSTQTSDGAVPEQGAFRSTPTADDGAVASSTPTSDSTVLTDSMIRAELLLIAMEPVEYDPGCVYSLATQHNICGVFAEFFIENGGTEVFGAPISEMYIANGVSMQHFERSRFEWQPGVGGAAKRRDIGTTGRSAAPP